MNRWKDSLPPEEEDYGRRPSDTLLTKNTGMAALVEFQPGVDRVVVEIARDGSTVTVSVTGAGYGEIRFIGPTRLEALTEAYLYVQGAEGSKQRHPERHHLHLVELLPI